MKKGLNDGPYFLIANLTGLRFLSGCDEQMSLRFG
jgi:hypothetical protein